MTNYPRYPNEEGKICSRYSTTAQRAPGGFKSRGIQDTLQDPVLHVRRLQKKNVSLLVLLLLEHFFFVLMMSWIFLFFPSLASAWFGPVNKFWLGLPARSNTMNGCVLVVKSTSPPPLRGEKRFNSRWKIVIFQSPRSMGWHRAGGFRSQARVK